jgi:hypothetical protein
MLCVGTNAAQAMWLLTLPVVPLFRASWRFLDAARIDHGGDGGDGAPSIDKLVRVPHIGGLLKHEERVA